MANSAASHRAAHRSWATARRSDVLPADFVALLLSSSMHRAAFWTFPLGTPTYSSWPVVTLWTILTQGFWKIGTVFHRCAVAYLPCSLLKGKQEHSFLKNNSLSQSLCWINFVFIQAKLFIWHINSLEWLIWKCSVHINIQSICMCVWWTLIYYGHIENVAWVVDNKLFCWNIVFWTTLPLKGVSVLS